MIFFGKPESTFPDHALDTPKTECIDQAFAERGAKARFCLDGIQDRRIRNLGRLRGRAPQSEGDQNLMHDRNPERKGGIEQDTDPGPDHVAAGYLAARYMDRAFSAKMAEARTPMPMEAPIMNNQTRPM